MMEIIQMNVSYAEQIAALERICFSSPWSIKSIMSEVENPLSYWLVAVENGKLLGYVGSQSVMDEADVMNIAVDPACRRQGLAERLLKRMIEDLNVRDVHSLTLEVRASNEPAIRLYGKLGFALVGRRPNYYRAPKEDALIYRKEW